jgi:hypothetical protein
MSNAGVNVSITVAISATHLILADVGARRVVWSAKVLVVGLEKYARWMDALLQMKSVIIDVVWASASPRAAAHWVMWSATINVVRETGVVPATAVARRGCAASLQRAHRVNSAVVAKFAVGMAQSAGSYMGQPNTVVSVRR